jgi:HAE1 family hydrophobic/amphiphilic exporter-1
MALALSDWGAMHRGFTFMPEVDMNNVSVAITMPDNTDRKTAVELADEVARRALTVDHVETVGAMMTNSGSVLTMMQGQGGENDVTLYITLPEGEFGLVAGRQIEKLCADMPCQVTASTVMNMDMLTGSGISIKVYGDDMEQLQSAARTLAARIGQVPGTASVSDGLDETAPALHVSVDRTAAMKKGMTVAQIYLQIAAALTDSATNAGMTLDDTSMDVIIENAEGSRLTREKLLDLVIDPDSAIGSMSGMSGMTGGMSGMTGGSASDMMGSMASGMMGGMGEAMTGGSSAGEDLSGLAGLTGETGEKTDRSFRLGEVATVEETVSLNTIQRDQQRRYVAVTSDVAEGYNITRVTADVQRAVDGLELPEGVTVSFDGENEAIMEAMRQLLLMLLLGVLLVYFIMVAQFQSLKSPFIVMFTIPLAFTGGFLALLISGIEISVISLIGFVMLVGIIVNNGIVLVDYINQQRQAGMERREAIIDAGVTRMRPILMTSLTTILGLIVMALAKNAGTTLMQPVALVCIGGLLYATLMTLFVVPCMYDMMNKRELRKVDEAELKTVDL